MLMLPMAQASAEGSSSYANFTGGVGGAGDIGTLHVVDSASATSDRASGIASSGGNVGTTDHTSGISTTGSNADTTGGSGIGLTGGSSTSSGGDGSNGGNADESEINNNQVNLDTVWNNTNIVADDVNGDVNGAAAATANAFQAITFNNTVVNNNQYASGAAVGSDLNAMTTNVNGSVNLSNTVACNSADVSTDPAYTVVNSKQECAVGDPSQATNVFAAQVQNDVNVAGAVAANVYTEDTNAKYNYVNSNQINESAVNSTTNVQTYNVGGTVNVSSSAVGNTAQVVHY